MVMLELESLKFNYLIKENKQLNLLIKNKINFIYHNNIEFFNSFINLFNGKEPNNKGSIIIDKIILKSLTQKERNTFFHNHISYCSVLKFSYKNTTINKLLKLIKNIYKSRLTDVQISLLLKSADLDKILDNKISELTNFQSVLLNIILSIIKKPKILIMNSIDLIIDNSNSIILKELLSTINSLELDINILWLTNNKNYKDLEYSFYNLELDKYYQLNENLTLYTSHQIEIKNHNDFKSNFNIIKFCMNPILFQWKIILLLLLNTLSFVGLYIISTKELNYINYLIIYTTVLILLFLMSFIVIYSIFIKNKNYLINLNISGINNLTIIFTLLLFIFLLSIIPIILSLIIFLPIFYSTSLFFVINLNFIFYPILAFMISIFIITLISSIKLRVHINE